MNQKERSFSRYAREAAALLGRRVRLGRLERRWTEQELADRAGISRATLQKIEKGELTVAIGLVFEVASLVGVVLFETDRESLARHTARADEKLALLPATVRKSGKLVDDTF